MDGTSAIVMVNAITELQRDLRTARQLAEHWRSCWDREHSGQGVPDPGEYEFPWERPA